MLCGLKISYLYFPNIFINTGKIKNNSKDSLLIKFIPDIEKAVDILSKNSILNLESFPDKNNQEILAIGFPEVIRWNEFKDIVETTSNQLLYVQYGSKYSDFSIGIFQMKPSFVENIENYCLKYFSINQKNIFNNITLNDKSEQNNRSIRLKRLSNAAWQFYYLKLYWYVANHKFKNMVFHNQEERIRFYASAYNYGFTQPAEKIKKWQLKSLFPFGKNYVGQQLSYADMSMVFFDTYSCQIVKSKSKNR